MTSDVVEVPLETIPESTPEEPKPKAKAKGRPKGSADNKPRKLRGSPNPSPQRDAQSADFVPPSPERNPSPVRVPWTRQSYRTALYDSWFG